MLGYARVREGMSGYKGVPGNEGMLGYEGMPGYEGMSGVRGDAGVRGNAWVTGYHKSNIDVTNLDVIQPCNITSPTLLLTLI